MTKVESVAHLRRMVRNGQRDFFIRLAGGLVRSSKHVEIGTDNQFYVLNESDDTEDIFTDEDLSDSSTTIGWAITNGAFYNYD